MIITVTNYCENIGKTTFVVYLTNYFLSIKKFPKVFIIDHGKGNAIASIFRKESHKTNPNIQIDILSNENKSFLLNETILSALQDSEDLYILDLKSDFENEMVIVLKWSDSIIVPFANYQNILESTFSMGKLTASLNCKAFFVENFSIKNNSSNLDLKRKLEKFGVLIQEELPTINNFKTSFLNLNDQLRFKKVFDSLSYSLFD